MGDAFAPFAEGVPGIVADTVWCPATTADAADRPRSRILHPIWEVTDDRPVVWVMTGRTPVKTAHLAATPHGALSDWNPGQDAAIAVCVASSVEDAQTKRHVWGLFASAPPPLGYDPSGGGVVAGPDGPVDVAGGWVLTIIGKPPWVARD